jgi:hypothetical protein
VISRAVTAGSGIIIMAIVGILTQRRYVSENIRRTLFKRVGP